jgi:hypothetical protein
MWFCVGMKLGLIIIGICVDEGDPRGMGRAAGMRELL